MPFLKEKCTICTQKNSWYLFSLLDIKWILELSLEFPSDKPLAWCWWLPSLFFQSTPPSRPLDHVSNCLVDISLIATRHLKLKLSKADSLFCTPRPTVVSVHLILLKIYLLRCPNKTSSHLSQIILPHPHCTNHHIFWSLSQCFRTYLRGSACTHLHMHAQAKPSVLIASYGTFSYPFAPVNWSL